VPRSPLVKVLFADDRDRRRLADATFPRFERYETIPHPLPEHGVTGIARVLVEVAAVPGAIDLAKADVAQRFRATRGTDAAKPREQPTEAEVRTRDTGDQATCNEDELHDYAAFSSVSSAPSLFQSHSMQRSRMPLLVSFLSTNLAWQIGHGCGMGLSHATKSHCFFAQFEQP
jgi:hypothetical protein